MRNERKTSEIDAYGIRPSIETPLGWFSLAVGGRRQVPERTIRQGHRLVVCSRAPAAFGPDEVWPRASRPRVVSQEVIALLDKLPKNLAAEVRESIDSRGLGAADARILGRAYVKQVDVAIARWDPEPELILSTKAMSSSFGKNLSNRFEEAYGDAANLRGRYPLAVGLGFVQRGTIVRDEPGAFARTIDMTRNLRDRGDGHGYATTALVLVDWDDDDPAGTAKLVEEQVPDDLGVAQFMKVLIAAILEATPIDEHVRVRELYENDFSP